MKRFILAALAALVAVTGFVSCKKDSVNALVGTWEASSVQMNVQGIEMNMDIQEMNVNIEMTFNEDGTGNITEEIEGDSFTAPFEYSLNKDILSLTVEGETGNVPVRISKNTLTLTVTGDMIAEEEFSGTIDIIFTRK